MRDGALGRRTSEQELKQKSHVDSNHVPMSKNQCSAIAEQGSVEGSFRRKEVRCAVGTQFP